MSRKGAQFERDTCRQLSLWWTDGKRDDVFWRTSNSGGRATVRGRKGKRTEGQHGDMAATHPIGRKFLQCVTVEMKNGYPRASMFDLVDRDVASSAILPYEKWMLSVVRNAHDADSLSWWLIHHRSRRETLLWMPWLLWCEIKAHYCKPPKLLPSCKLTVPVRVDKESWYWMAFLGCRLDGFLAKCHPAAFLSTLDAYKKSSTRLFLNY